MPDCTDRACGPDGCGKSCGACAEGLSCQEVSGKALACVPPGTCLPDCVGRECGPDGCGGSCGPCDGGACTKQGQCEPCVPVCGGACGPDGCGGTCGACEDGSACGGDLQCEPLGSPCGSLAAAGQCNGAVLSRCGPGGLTAVDCGAVDLLCDWNPDAGGYDCVVAACAPACTGRACGDDGCGGACGTCPADEACDELTGQCGAALCGDLDEAGRCEGAILRWCGDGRVRTRDCAADGGTCGWDGDANDGLGRWGCL